MKRGLGIAVLFATAAACSSSTTPTSPARLQVQLTLNGARLGSFSCSDGLFFATSVSNLAKHPIQLERLAVRFSPTAGSCREYLAPIDPLVSTRLEGGQTAQLRRFDAAGQLCELPYGASECAWRATATVTTDAGAAEDVIGFETFRSPAGCQGVVPRLINPTAGAVLSGVVAVTASVAESQNCVISARTIVEGFSEQGSPIFSSVELDLGDQFRWETTLVPNGRYWLTAFQNCCRTRSSAVIVTVRN